MLDLDRITLEKDQKISLLEERFQEYKDYATSKLQQQLTEISNLKDALEVLKEKELQYEKEKMKENEDEDAWMETNGVDNGNTTMTNTSPNANNTRLNVSSKVEKGSKSSRLPPKKAATQNSDFFDFSVMQVTIQIS